MIDPEHDTFGRLVDDALAALPRAFLDRLGDVAIVIEDEPSADQLDLVGAHGLFGLYQGVPRTTYGAGHAAIPTKITIFRGPLERAYPGEALATAVADVVRHEVAHHFGISDDRLRTLQAERR